MQAEVTGEGFREDQLTAIEAGLTAMSEPDARIAIVDDFIGTVQRLTRNPLIQPAGERESSLQRRSIPLQATSSSSMHPNCATVTTSCWRGSQPMKPATSNSANAARE